jgi:hypothetical protein
VNWRASERLAVVIANRSASVDPAMRIRARASSVALPGATTTPL